ncbi:HAD family hydrolase [Sphingobacterium suaedae]|uniref:phosphoglycolate phosphatase n=1 Tax=Sphingobacterium suaedae TaxID=1686402 RepID=A0ABW5KLM3_9SPHI
MKLIIFDLDGTLIDTLADLANSCNYALNAHGYPVHPISAYRIFVGNGITKLVQRALPDGHTPETIERVKKTFVEYYTLHANDSTQPYLGIMEALITLKGREYLLSVASNKYHEATEALVGKYFGNIGFDVVLGHREGKPAKPDPQIVFDTLETLNVDPKNCIYVGDSSVDMNTATAAGVTSVGVTWGFRSESELREHGADHLIHHPRELPALADRLLRSVSTTKT